ncbi:hypothetical protein LCGC14_1664810 [marine sediment metagenome]|uniref:Uncharacterized protein n=1 Tax=marine sediment metagenome TaxID=412755 RepID=A0A0F9HSZ2_9ZZZZ
MTVEFNEDSKLLWTLLKAEQASIFIFFLEDEIRRHRLAIHDAKYKQGYGKEGSLEYQLWQSAILRHVNDVEYAKIVIQEVKHWFGMEE